MKLSACTNPQTLFVFVYVCTHVCWREKLTGALTANAYSYKVMDALWHLFQVHDPSEALSQRRYLGMGERDEFFEAQKNELRQLTFVSKFRHKTH